MSRPYLSHHPIFTKFAVAWLIVGALVFTWVVWQNVVFYAQPGGGDDMAIGLISILVGLPTLLQVGLATWLLFAQDRGAQLTLTVMMTLVPAALLLGEPVWLLLVISIAAITLFAARSQR